MSNTNKISSEEGYSLVKAARKIVTEFLKNGIRIKLEEKFQDKFSFHSGVFVTLNDSNGLRGCIGFPLPHKKLHNALEDAAIAAATEDPRFNPVKLEELETITFEVTVLTPPKKIEVKEPQEYLTKIKIGQDGLIVKYGYSSGLLLPQVAIEYGWNVKEFLEHTCQKAGLPKDYWMKPEIGIKKFEGIVFKELSPKGKITQEKLLD